MGRKSKQREKDEAPSAKAEAVRQRPTLRARLRPAGSARFRDEPREIAVFDPEQVEKVLDALPESDALVRAADRLQGLAHPSRVQAIIALSVGELCVGDVAAVLGLSLSATSTMLKQLRSLGFIATRHAGKQTYYRSASKIPGMLLAAAFHEEPSLEGAA